MQSIRNSILQRFRVSSPVGIPVFSADGVLRHLSRNMCVSTSAESNMVMDRVVALVKKFDRVDASKVTETADFQKDLSLDSLDRVELVMALEEEFSIEIPEEKADKLSCCADVAKYIAAEQKTGNP